MKRFYTLFLAAALALGAVGASGCVTDDALVTCDNFDDFLFQCYANCSTSFYCEDHYENLDLGTQQLLDDCSDLLYDQAAAGTCYDRTVDGYSCEGLMEDYLEVVCTW